MNTKNLLASYLTSLEVRSRRGAISHRTRITYEAGLKTYAKLVGDAPVSTETYTNFLKRVQGKESTVLTKKSAVLDFYRYCHAEHGIAIDILELQDASHRYAPRKTEQLPEFDEAQVNKLIQAAEKLSGNLVNLRNRALLISAADTGLRAFEICGLKISDLKTDRVVIVGKRRKKAVVRFSPRAIQYIQEYLSARAELDSQYPDRSALPLFARHDKSASTNVYPLLPGGFWAAVKAVGEAAGVDVDKVWPHALRHSFVTNILKVSGNLKLAQELARHANIQMTQHYAHLTDADLDKGYDAIFGG